MNQSSSQSTKIPSNWLLPVRLAWIIIAAFHVTVFFISIPGELAKPATFNVNNFSGNEWSQEEIEMSARKLNISIDALANIDKTLNTSIIPALLYFSVGSIIFIKKSDDWVALITSLIFFMFFNKTEFLAEHIPALKLLADLMDIFVSILLFWMFMIFPDGRFIPRWIRWIAIYTALVQVWRIFYPQPYSIYFPALALPTMFSILYSQVHRYRRVASPAQQLQIKWVVFINSISFGALGTYFLIYAIFPKLSEPGPVGLLAYLIGNFIWTLFLILLPVSFAIAILRSKLWDIDFIIRRTLVYAMLSGLLGLVYFGAVTLTQNFLTAGRGQQTAVGGQPSYSPPSAVVIVLTTLAIAALFNPLRRRLQDFIDRRFYRQKYDAERALSVFAATARSETSVPALTGSLMSLVQETLQPESVVLTMLPTGSKQQLTGDVQSGEV